MALPCVLWLLYLMDYGTCEEIYYESVNQLEPSVSTRYGVRQELCPNGVDPQRNPDGNIKWCRLDAECRLNYECVPIVGLNHFGNPVKYCCPTKYSYCSRKPKTNNLMNCAKPAITLYYFDITRLRCRPYTVTGCDELESTVDEIQNRFGTIKDCRSKCETTACEVGETPLYLDDDFEKPYLCESRDKCPHGYLCRYDKLFRRQVCCGKTTFGICPSGQRPCIHPLTASTIKCNPHSYDAACPSGYACSPTVVGSSWGFCCSQALVANCPRNTRPYINIATNMPHKCTVGVTVCNHGYVCQNSEPNSANGFCCTPPNSAEFVARPMSRLQTTTTAKIIVIENKSKSKSESVEEKKISTESREKSEQIEITSKASLEFSKEDKSTFEETKVITEQAQKPTKSTIIERTTKTFSKSTHRPKTVRTKSHREELKCPEDFNPMNYPKTGLIMHCTRSRKSDCPAPSKCLKGWNDPLNRTLCCLHQDDQIAEDISSNSDSNENDRTFKIVADLNLGHSEDPACPTIILGRSCRAGSVDDCEDNFFCQFNKQFREFLCCSYLKNAGNNVLYGPPSFSPFK